MYKHLMAWLAALLLASLAWPAFAQNLVSDQDPLSSLAEDDVSYWVDNVGAYDGKVDLSVLRSEIQERIHGANLQTGTTYTLQLSDAGKVVELSNASAITLTIPANASVAFPINTVIQIVQGGAGAITISITSDTLNGTTEIDGQWKGVTLWKRDTTQWVSITGHVDSFEYTADVETVAEQDYVLWWDAPFSGSVTNVRTKSQSGTCTLTGKINTTALGGTANSVSTSAQEQAHSTDNAFAKGDKLLFTISSNSACTDLAVAFYGTR